MGFIADRIAQIDRQENPFFVAEMRAGYVVVGDSQRFPGYTLFLCRWPVHELHELPAADADLFLQEMRLVAAAVWRAFSPEKLNVEMLGNGDPHLHCHIFPRRTSDGVKGPVWWLPYAEMQEPAADEVIASMKAALLRALQADAATRDHVLRAFR